MRLLLCLSLLAVTIVAIPLDAKAESKPQLDAAFRLMYELKFEAARAMIRDYQTSAPEDPLGIAAEAASHLFEEFHVKGVLTSEFFLDDRRLLGGIEGSADPARQAAFLAANERARTMAGKKPDDPGSLFVLTITDGMLGDYQALIEKRQFESLRLIRRAEKQATRLLVLRPEMVDAYVAIGAAKYILGCLPAYKRAFLWLGGYSGDRKRGMEMLELTATAGHYLRPLAKTLLALAARRENQLARATSLFQELAHEFPSNEVFAREAGSDHNKSSNSNR
jgi:hypothetical protein